MALTLKQEQGLKIAVERYKSHEKYTCISGYAGSGKSYLISHIVEALNLNEDEVAYVAYTGKAAQVLREHGCRTATTAHKLLYKTVPRGRNGQFIHIPKPQLDENYKLIVVDEVSMLPNEMWSLLLSHNIYVIATGDPAQLPPVSDDYNHVLDNPHIFLDEIMRQAKENEIIRFSMDIREQKPLSLYRGDTVRIVTSQELENPGIYLWADQIIVGKNKTKDNINNKVRYMLHDQLTEYPMNGDKIICLKNNWSRATESGDALVNGLTGIMHNINTFKEDFNDTYTEDYFYADFCIDENNSFEDLKMDGMIFKANRPSKNKRNPNRWIPKDYIPEQFDYGYAITCHKAQGAQFNNVLVLEEYLKNDTKEEHARWLYTAATRAIDKLIIVKN